MILKKGQTYAISAGDYSDYHIKKIFIPKKDIHTDEIVNKLKLISGSDILNESFVFEVLSKSEEVICKEINIGNYYYFEKVRDEGIIGVEE